MKKILGKRIIAFVMALCMITGMVFSDIPAFSMQVQAEELPTIELNGGEVTWNLTEASCEA